MSTRILLRKLILDILSRLPISSLIQLKSVCRAWRMLSRHPDLISIHITRMAKNNPCLILHSDYPIRNQLYFVDIPADYNKEEKVKRSHVPFRAAMPEFNVVGSICQELLKSMQYSNLEEVVFGFGFDPTTKEYKVVKIVSYIINADRIYGRSLRVADMISEVQVFSLGYSTWRSMGKLKIYHLDQWSSQVLVNRRLHWVAWTRRYHPRRTIVSFVLADEQFKEIRTSFKGCNYHLVALGGCLSAAVSTILRKRTFVRVVCLLKYGDILLEYKSRALVSYDTVSEEFKDLMFEGIRRCYKTIVHAGSLNWTYTFIDT
ncbi:hypothetical protein CIPAW_04G111100 [Carya illinoinensis]|uniref:F-box domain-containing protein n=1 Tax=Carya illinoinensis TaxID=32201 RepID=A0A8T1QUV0_CARIL|nr:hypothetical protein CIPAW_04G111100 [Carya illinoinensis]